MQLSPTDRGKDTPRKRIGTIFNLFLSLFITGLLCYVAIFGIASIPPLGTALNPNAGIWNTAQIADLQNTETLHFPDLQKPVTITFEKNGTPHIQAATDDDLFWTIGYLHARFRLTQMDLQRRHGEGRLAEIAGPKALDSDKFEDTLGLQWTAEADWKAIKNENRAGYKALTAYSKGANALIQQEEQNNTLPVMFTLLNYQPSPWTPVDSLVVQEDMAQTLDFTSTPLDYCLLVHSLGYDRTMAWFPVLPPDDTQHPYDTGSFPKPADNTPQAQPDPLPAQKTACTNQNTTTSITDLVNEIAQLPTDALHEIGSSNNWAINGPKTQTGNALMAGDPHLHLTLPSIWYQLDFTSPNYTARGVSIPGLPAILIGQNQHISWSETDVQNQSTLFYVEQVDPKHPDQYKFNDKFQKMQKIHYDIPVKGGAIFPLDVLQTAHGPVLTDQHMPDDTTTADRLPGRTISVTWMGSRVSTQIDSFLSIMQASNSTQFRDALSTWVAPTLNFVYADDQGNIGMIAPGAYPIVKAGAPWLPLPGTGEAEITGFIPFDNVPQVKNPANNLVFSANQRPVSGDYPYYIGTSLNDFENGYRADEIYTQLNEKKGLTMQDMEKLQNDTHDYLAGLIVPQLLDLLKKQDQKSLSSLEKQGIEMLAKWDDTMQENAASPSIWWTFWQQYVNDTFGPWWKATNVPTATVPPLAIQPHLKSLTEDLETWTLHDSPANSAFTLPTGQTRTASDIMLQAYKETIDHLTKTQGNNPQQWTWGKIHMRKIDSLTHADSLAYGPFASGGDSWTINAADTGNGTTATHGPSCRIIVDWGNNKSELIYPGGQDENPLSPWYQDRITTWQNGQYAPMLDTQQAENNPHTTWTLSR